MLTFNSYAKINLYLSVLNKRPDNYHDINSLFERISLSDRITLTPLKKNTIELYSNERSLPCDASNLAFKAAKLLKDEFKVAKGVRIRLTKRIPIGAGLGGGSSNAAYVLMGLNKLWGLKLSRQRLSRLGAKLGSDIPFFIQDLSFGLVSSRGEKIKPVPELSGLHLWHILVVPRINVPTPFIYNKLDDLRKSGLTIRVSDGKLITLVLKNKDFSGLNKALFNDLEAVTLRFYPEVVKIKKAILHFGANPTLMSGSGPAVFSIFSSRKDAVRLFGQLKEKHRLWRIFLVRTV
ncbi:MAG: 4-(cytidine 5'-diphospho)-2-C-methyl-D-erythritol kinase [Candidatus Omnitrophica bacterium]|nr:4-(cytidine 5'-diphospho)-2-C-methyl-D-erythritol kinase [Candidatus Omnitrophota bacterium]MDD5079899.1 4-(cytidine 5'-diphospho)-2-C-methyl-D-erythritol kinase [Candidatus Omnitrophota bacterium]